MLCRNNHPQKYIDAYRIKVEVQISTYKNLSKAAEDLKTTKLNIAIESSEKAFFNNMVLALENYFVNKEQDYRTKEW